LVVGTVIIVSYTYIGGFLAVVWTDAIQASLMMLALIAAPVLVISGLNSSGAVWQDMETINPGSTELMADLGFLGLISLLAWGLGYVGQPHILARFMAAESLAKIDSARRIAMCWMIVVMIGSVTTGLAGIIYFAEAPLANPETVFIALSQNLFNPWVAGVITAAILSAIMSTIDSQLLVSSSVVGEDLYRVFLRPDASDKELLLVSRTAVVIIAFLALLIASDRDSRVLDLVSYAWAGFGAAFGPVVVFSLFWRSMTAMSAIAGMTLGALTVVIWSNLSGGIFDLYEIVPGFLLSSIAIVLITRWRKEDDVAALVLYDETQGLLGR